jgi:cell division protease FtsH
VIDEMESFLSDREQGGGAGGHRVEEVAEFLRRIPEAVKGGVLIIGMTNRIEMIDPAILRRGRFDHVISVAMPTEDEVRALLESLVAKLPTAPGLQLGPVASRLAGRPLSDAAFVVREAGRLAARAGKGHVDQDALDRAIATAPIRDPADAPRPRIGFV